MDDKINITDMLLKLCRIWSDAPRIFIMVMERTQSFSTSYDSTTETYKVILSSSVKSFAEPDTLENYRFCRYATWHEAMHTNMTDFGNIKLIKELNLDLSAYNILEDYRIEEIGLKEYLGYRSEKDFIRKTSTRKYMENVHVKSDMGDVFQYVLNELHYRDGEAPLPSKYSEFKHRLDGVIDDARSQLFKADHGKRIIDLTETLTRIWNDMGFPKSGANSMTSMADLANMSPQMSKKGMKEMSDKYQTSSHISNEHKRTVKAKSDKEGQEKEGISGDSKVEMEELSKPGTMKITIPEGHMAGYSQYSNYANSVKPTLRHIIKSIKRELSEVNSDEGSEVDTDEYLNRSPKPYIDDVKNRVMNDILLIFDVSASTSDFNHLYIGSLISLCEVLTGLNISYGVYSFCEPSEVKSLRIIKTKQEPYNDIIKGRIGSMRSEGRTPTASMLISVRETLHRYKHIFLFTDGASTEPLDETKAQFHKMSNKSFYVIGYANSSCYSSIRNHIRYCLHARHARNYRIISDIAKLPHVILELVKERNGYGFSHRH